MPVKTTHPTAKSSLKNPTSSWDTADADPWLASPQERGETVVYGPQV